jgi:hypothetical protein
MARRVSSCGRFVCALAGVVAALAAASTAAAAGPLGLEITGGPEGVVASRTATFTFTTTTPASYTCSLDGGKLTPCDSGVTYPDLGDGSHEFMVVATGGTIDTVSDRAARKWTVAVPPDTRIESSPAPSVATTTAVFTFSAAPSATSFECSLDGAAFEPCTSPRTYTDLRRTRHRFDVRAVSEVGADESPARWDWEIQPVAPVLDTRIVSSPSATTRRSVATLAFESVPAGLGFECSLDHAAYVPCTSPFTTARLRRGVHSFFVRSVGPAGRDATPAAASWTFLPVVLELPPTENGSGWMVPAGIAAAFLVAAGALTLAARFRLRGRRLEWQLEASEGEPHGPCRAGRHIQKELTLKPARRSIAHLELDARDARGDAIVRRVEGAPAGGLNDAVRTYRRDSRISPELRVALLPVATALVAELEGWLGPQDVDRQDVVVRAHLEGGKAEWKFTPWRCVRGEWKSGRSWTVEVEDERDVAAAAVSHPYPAPVAAEVLLSQLSAFVAEVDVRHAQRPPERAPVLHG